MSGHLGFPEPAIEPWTVALDGPDAVCWTLGHMDQDDDAKLLFWVGSSLKDLKTFPFEVRRSSGFALWQAQRGGKHPDAKVLRAFGGAGVLEVVEDHDGSTYRAVYTVKFSGVVYVLHAFQKKSKKGIKTAVTDLATIRNRLKRAEDHHEEWRQAREGGEKDPG